MRKRVACYVRVSTENQLENYSIEEQTDRLKAYCKAKDWEIYRFYTDGGYSGGNIDRPALQQLLKDISNNYIELVVVYKLDRLSRSQKDTLTLIEDDFLANNVDFVSMSENFDTSTPFGKAMIGILSVFAQLEKDQITERFTMGRIGRAKNGYYHGGPTPPTGYDYVDGELIVNEYEALQIQEIYRKFLKGQSITSIWRYMSENYTTKYGTWSSHNIILNVLRNSVYIGKVKFKGKEYDGKHEPIISPEIYYQAQKLLSGNDRYKSNPYTKTPFRACNLLSSLVFCSHCGARYTGNHGYYVCYSRGKTNKNKIKDPNCKNKRWKIEELDTIVQNEILNLVYNDEILDSLDQNFQKSDSGKYSIRIEEIEKQISRMIDLYQVGNISIDSISSRIDKLKKEKATLIQKSKQIADDKISMDEVKKVLDQVEEVFKGNDLEHKRLLTSTLIERINVDNDNVSIKWRFM